ncbi:hypothetical protein J437_LFUL017600, partial [Ladona fulva]
MHRKRMAVEFWKSGKKGPLKLDAVRHNFSFVTSRVQLHRYEKQIMAKEKFIAVRDISLAMEMVKVQQDSFTESNKVKRAIRESGASQVLNTDQSGFKKEVHSGRTLEFRDTKTVESVYTCLVSLYMSSQSIHATIHFYTCQPTISVA